MGVFQGAFEFIERKKPEKKIHSSAQNPAEFSYF